MSSWPAVLLVCASTLLARGQDQRALVRQLQSTIQDDGASPEQKVQYIDGVRALFNQDDPSVDEESVRLALVLAEELEDGDRLAALHVALGYRRNEEGKFDDALDELRLASDVAESPPTRLWTLVVRVDPCLQAHRFDEARAALEEARQVLASMQAPERESRLQFHVAEFRCWLALGLLDLCHEPLQEMERLAAEEAVDGDWAAIAIPCRLDWLYFTRRYGEALDYGATLDRELLHLHPAQEALVDLRLGASAWEAGDDARAGESFNAVRRNAATTQADLAQVESRLAEIAASVGRRDEALTLLRSARARLGPLEGANATSLDDQLYLAALESRLGSGGRAELDRCFERFLAERSAAQPRPGGMSILGTMRERMFLAEWMRTQMAAAPGEAGLLAALDGLCRLHALGGLPRALSAQIGASAPGFAALREQLTDEDSGLLVYFPGRRQEGFVFAIDDQEIRCAAIPGEARLAEESQALALWMTGNEKSAAALARATEKLGAALLPASIRPQLEQWKDVGIVGLEHLGSIHPELLAFEGKRLEQRMAVSYPLSLPTAALLHRRADQQPQEFELDLVLLAAPSLGDADASAKAGKLQTIPFEQEHATRLVGPLEEQRVRVFARDAATAEALASEDVHGARILAVVTHGERDDTRERPAVFRLASRNDQATRIGCTEIEGLRVPPVVLLLVCEASKSPPRPADAGTSDLGGALLQVGAQVVLLAPSTIDLEDGCELQELFLSQLQSGASPALALNRARLRWLEDTHADPSRALLRVVGLGDRRIF